MISDTIIGNKQSENLYPTPHTGLAPDVIPEADGSHTGVSTHCIPTQTDAQYPPELPAEKPEAARHWYVLRTTYGRERKAYAYLTAHGMKAFCPVRRQERVVGGSRKTVTVSLIPNMLFVHGTEEHVQAFVYDNLNLPFLRFYCRCWHDGAAVRRTPLVVPDGQMESFMLICRAADDDIFIAPEVIHKFEKGRLVRITQGKFAGVVGRVARVCGQQRVGILIENMMTVATAYVPSGYLAPVDSPDGV